MINSKLHSAVNVYCHQNGGNFPNLIIMHPKTWETIIVETFGSVKAGIGYIMKESKFRGVTVLRSSDMEEGIFILK